MCNQNTSQEARITAKWEHALFELVVYDFVEEKGYEGSCFQITHQGYEYADTLKKDLHITNVLQGKSSVETSASVQQDDLDFDAKTGTYISKTDGMRYCHKCWHSSPPQRVPLKKEDNGWSCTCGEFYDNPNYSHKYDDRDRGTQDEDLLNIS